MRGQRRRAPRLAAAEQRTLRAFAAAMAPEHGALPAASGPEREPGTIDPVAELAPLIATLSPGSVTQMRLALRAFEWLAFPQRFSRMSTAQRQRLISRIDARGSQVKRDLVLFIKVLTGIGYANDPRVQAAIGYEARCEVDEPDRGSASPERGSGSPLGDLEPSGPEEECDVVIVGSGAGGAVAAAVLAEAGLEVIVLEAGPYLDRDSYPEQPIPALASLYRDGGSTVAIGRPAIPIPVGRAVGGTTVINSGTCFRAPEPVLDRWAAEHGIASAAELEPEFAEAEAMLDVRAVDPQRMGRNGQVLREGAEAMGVEHSPLHRNAGGCHQCSSCPQGCRLDAKRAMHVTYLPRAVTAGARVRAGVEATEIIFERGRAAGVRCRAGVAAPGRSGTPVRRPRSPGGGARRRGLRHARAAAAFGLQLAQRPARAQPPHPAGRLGGRELRRAGSRLGGRDAELRRRRVGITGDHARGDVHPAGVRRPLAARGRPRAPAAAAGAREPGLNRGPGRRPVGGPGTAGAAAGRCGSPTRFAARTPTGSSSGSPATAELLYAAGAREVFPQIAGIASIARNRIAELEASPPRRSALRLDAFHPMGTARMDRDPGRGVVGSDGAVHGAERLYVADASLLPSSLGVNPMLTIIAIASRVARGLAAAAS